MIERPLPEYDALFQKLAKYGESQNVEESRILYQRIQPISNQPFKVSVTNFKIDICGAIIRVRRYRPKSLGDLPIIIHFHGGGLAIGGLDTHDHHCKILCTEIKAIVISVEYRLAPEFKCPTAHEDSYKAIKWISANYKLLGGNSDNIYITGDSAGANVCLYCLIKNNLDKEISINGALLIVPSVIFGVPVHVDVLNDRLKRQNPILTNEQILFFERLYFNNSMCFDRSTFNYLEMDMSYFPNTLIILAECDPLFFEGMLLFKKLKKSGVKVDLIIGRRMVHTFFSMCHIYKSSMKYIYKCCDSFKAIINMKS